MDLLITWLVLINLVTFGVYGYDKSIAGSKRRRVPESVLLGLALVGGSVGAILGMLAFRHKTSKGSFQLKLLVVIIVQVVLVVILIMLL